MATYIMRNTLQNMMTYRGLGKVSWNKKNTLGNVGDIQIHVVKSLSDRVLSKIPEHSIIVHTTRKKCSRYENFECFHVDELQQTLIHHPCVPHHRLVDKTELETLESQIGSREHFPIIMKDDAVIRFYGWHTGQVVYVNKKYRIIK